jgi:hypothetical protein
MVWGSPLIKKNQGSPTAPAEEIMDHDRIGTRRIGKDNPRKALDNPPLLYVPLQASVDFHI